MGKIVTKSVQKAEINMKKHIATLLLLLVITTFALAACSNPEKTDTAIRWEDGETLSYKISIADYNKDTTKSGLFGSIVYNNDVYYRDLAISTSMAAETNHSSRDEIVPVAADGVYTIVYNKLADGKWKVTTTQTIDVTYDIATVEESLSDAAKSGWTQLLASAKSTTDTQATFTTTTNTSVVFDAVAQRPDNSSVQTDGFYVGKSNVQKSVSNVSTVYDFDKLQATVTVDGVEQVNKLEGYNAAYKFIDSNQLLSYIRSLEKSTNKFQDSPRVQVYVAAANQIHTANFGFTYSRNIVIGSDDNMTFASINSVNCALGSVAYMQTQNLPDSLGATPQRDQDGKVITDANDNVVTKALNVIDNGYGDKIPCYTISRFRVGSFTYSLNFDTLENGEEILKALASATKDSE